jgi:hypothetical protein
MPKRALELEILRGGRHEATFEALADPDDTGALRDYLTDWLEGNGWAEGHWPKFSLAVRYADEYKVRKTIRAGG